MFSINMKTEDELCDFLGKDLSKIEKLCRICLSDNLCNAVSIIKDSEKDVDNIESVEAKLIMDKELSLWEKILVLGRVKVNFKDDLLKYICEQCYCDIDIAYTFRIKCHKAESLLTRVFQSLTEEHKDSKLFKFENEIVDDNLIAEIQETCSAIKQECTDYNSDNFDDDYTPDNDFVLKNKQKRQTKRKSKKCPKKTESLQVKVENEVSIGELEGNLFDKGKKYICHECNKPLSTEKSLIRHIETMHSEEKKKKTGIVTGYGKERRFHCPECDYKCARRQALDYHMSTHTGLKPYQCDQCPRSFSQHCSLYSHRKTHSDKMYYTCQECGKQFKHRETFLNHRRVHSTELNYKCHMCNKGLKTQRTLDEHIKRHLQIKNYSCEVCGMQFVTKVEIINHSRKHNPKDTFKCTLCPYSSYCKKSLTIHVQRHSGQRPYKCDQCDYSACAPNVLRYHMRKHTKEQNYACPICDMKFRQSTSVNKHMMRKHGEKFRWNDTVDRRIYK